MQLVGYSFQLAQESKVATSRFGFVASFPDEPISLSIGDTVRTSEWILIDASIRGGHSGGPVFAADQNSSKIYLLGFVQGTSDSAEMCIVIPAHFILDLIQSIKIRSLQ